MQPGYIALVLRDLGRSRRTDGVDRRLVVLTLVVPPTAGITSTDVTAGIVVAGLLALAGIAYTMSSGAKLVLAVSDARPADPQQYRQLHDVIEDPSPNAFATGTSPERATITATTCLLATMNREELEGVIGHETSHIKKYDVRLILVVSTLIGMAALPTHYLNSWQTLFTANMFTTDLFAGVMVQLAYLAVFGALAITWFRTDPEPSNRCHCPQPMEDPRTESPRQPRLRPIRHEDLETQPFRAFNSRSTQPPVGNKVPPQHVTTGWWWGTMR